MPIAKSILLKLEQVHPSVAKDYDIKDYKGVEIWVPKRPNLELRVELPTKRVQLLNLRRNKSLPQELRDLARKLAKGVDFPPSTEDEARKLIDDYLSMLHDLKNWLDTYAKEKGYKSGWVYHKMKDMVGLEATNLLK